MCQPVQPYRGCSFGGALCGVGCYVRRFLARVAACADAVMIDHFMQGDGSADGARTRRTPSAGRYLA